MSRLRFLSILILCVLVIQSFASALPSNSAAITAWEQIITPLGSGFESTYPGGWVLIRTQNTVHCSTDAVNVIYTRSRTPGYTNDVDWVKWRPTLPATAYYRVYAYVPNYTHGDSVTGQARYRIRRSDGEELALVVVNQNDNLCGWVDLGEYWLNAGTSGYVYMGDYTGDNPYRLIAADGMKFVIQNRASNVPNLVSPADDATITSPTVSLQLQDTGDTDNYPRNYRDFCYRVENTSGTWGQDNCWTTNTSWSVTVPSAGTYRWRAQSGDGEVGSGWTNWRSFSYNDAVAPSGNLTSPTEGTKIGPGQIPLTAEASDNAGGVGVQSVEFKVVYDGQWHNIGTDTTAPYGINWTTPAGLRSQQIRFAIDVTDNVGNIAFGAGGQRTVNFIESQDNPIVVENWVPQSKRTYLNQRSLSPFGDSKCGSAAAAMMLAMNGIIGRDYDSLRDTANAIYPKSIKDGQILLYLITAQMRALGLNARESDQTADAGWETVKAEINAGRPVMVLSRKVTSGHFFVIVGYREEGTSHKIIVYDPYGRWLGSYRSYDRNTTDADSTKGKWVTYDYNTSWGGGWIVTGRPYDRAMAADSLLVENNPDPISEEPLEEAIYEGVLINESQLIFLPVVMREN